MHQSCFNPWLAVFRWLLGLLLTTPLAALAHTGVMPTTDLGHGLLHPLTGLDHLLAALGVGLWATLQHAVAGRSLMVVFLGALLIGLPLGAAGLSQLLKLACWPQCCC